MIEIPTAVTLGEQQLLSEVANDRLVYEAGALMGASTIALARHARIVVSVDPHDGYPRRDPSPTWELFKDNLRQAGVSNRVQAIRAKFQDALPTFQYGFAFADLTGQYDITKEFLDATVHIWRVAVHDYERNGCAGATRAVNEFLKAHHRDVTRVGSLILMENKHER